MMDGVYFSMPARVFFSRGALAARLPEARHYGRKALLVSGRTFLFRSGLREVIGDILARAGLECVSYAGVNPEPETGDVEKGAALCRRHACDCIIAVGGGSALDAGKAIAVCAVNDGPPESFFALDTFPRPPLPVIAVPTTCGTGSEVTRFAVLVDPAARTKKTINSEAIIPKLAILDPDLLQTLPEKLVAATAMDAFTHAAESFLARRADHLSRLLAVNALETLWSQLPRLRQAPDDTGLLDKIFLASLIAGLAINRTGTIVLHGMAYALTIRYRLHHGTANALLLPRVFAYLRDNGYENEISELEKTWGETARLSDFVTGLGLPGRLADIGADKDDLDELADLAVAGTRRALANMKIPMDRAVFRDILAAAL